MIFVFRVRKDVFQIAALRATVEISSYLLPTLTSALLHSIFDLLHFFAPFQKLGFYDVPSQALLLCTVLWLCHSLTVQLLEPLNNERIPLYHDDLMHNLRAFLFLYSVISGQACFSLVPPFINGRSLAFFLTEMSLLL